MTGDMMVYESIEAMAAEDVLDTRDIIETLDAWEIDTPDRPALEAFQDELAGYAEDYEYGAQVIADRYFQEYAQELAEDCDMVPDDAKWPMTCINWEWAARELQHDYSRVVFAGRDWWTR